MKNRSLAHASLSAVPARSATSMIGCHTLFKVGQASRRPGQPSSMSLRKLNWLLLLIALLTATASRAMTLNENFTTDPAAAGWQVFGNTNLFNWNAASNNLAVTWDSTQPNSYFYHPLNTTVTRHDDFSVSFDLNLADIASGVEPGKTGPLQIGFEFLNFAGATNASFQRGNFGMAPNVAGFDYYTDGYYSFGGTIFPSDAATVPSFISGVDSYDYAPQNISIYDDRLPTNQSVHISLSYTASNQTALVITTVNGITNILPALALDGPNGFGATNDDVLVDMFGICSFSSQGDDFDSVLAHGTVANLVINVPPPAQNLAGTFTNGIWQVQFDNHSGWQYTLERTANFSSWTNASSPAAGNGASLTLMDTNAPSSGAFYRIRADRP